MSESNQVSSGEPVEASGQNQEMSAQQSAENVSDVKQENSVAYETHRKLLGEKKKLQSQYEEIAQKFKGLEEKRMQDEGRKDELIESLRKRLDEVEGKYKGAVGTFAQKSISAQIEAEAAKMGCVDTRLLLKAIEDRFGELEVDDSFRVNESDVKAILEKQKSETPILFSQPAPKTYTGTPATPDVKEGFDLKKLTTSELAKLLAQSHKK